MKKSAKREKMPTIKTFNSEVLCLFYCFKTCLEGVEGKLEIQLFKVEKLSEHKSVLCMFEGSMRLVNLVGWTLNKVNFSL